MRLEDLYRMLRSSHVQAQGIVDTLNEPLIVVDQNFCVLTANPAFFEAFVAERDETIGQNFFALGNGQWDNEELRRLLNEVISTGTQVVGYQVTHDFPSIGSRTILLNARKMVHPDRNSRNLLVVFEDITHRRRAEADKDVLTGEVHHRMKNLLAVVRALAMQTEAHGRTGEEYRDAFLGRFDVMLKAQQLSFSAASEATLATVVRRETEALAASQIRIHPGPRIQLDASQVLPLSMILHELATNAMKYGALSDSHGLVHVTWAITPQERQTMLQLDWREEHGPPVTPPSRSGFGTRLIEFSAANSLGGLAELRFESKGLQARISVPLA